MKIFKNIFINMFNTLDDASISLVKSFLLKKVEDGAAIIELIAILEFLQINQRFDSIEIIKLIIW